MQIYGKHSKDGKTVARGLAVKKADVPPPWLPFVGTTEWGMDVERMLNQFFGRPLIPWWPERWLRTKSTEINAPTVDMYVDDDDIIIKAELAGMEKDDIKVSLTDHLLTLEGEKR